MSKSQSKLRNNHETFFDVPGAVAGLGTGGTEATPSNIKEFIEFKKETKRRSSIIKIVIGSYYYNFVKNHYTPMDMKRFPLLPPNMNVLLYVKTPWNIIKEKPTIELKSAKSWYLIHENKVLSVGNFSGNSEFSCEFELTRECFDKEIFIQYNDKKSKKFKLKLTDNIKKTLDLKDNFYKNAPICFY